jgi:hypothetical protein
MGLDVPRRLYLAHRPIRLDRLPRGGLFPAVLVAACLGGFWPGLLATVVATFGATYFLVEPPDSLEITTLERGRPGLFVNCVQKRVPQGGETPARNGIAGQESLRASVGSTEASASLPARVGVVGPTRARERQGNVDPFLSPELRSSTMSHVQPREFLTGAAAFTSAATATLAGTRPAAADDKPLQPIRGDKGASIIGPTNPARESQNSFSCRLCETRYDENGVWSWYAPELEAGCGSEAV